MKRRISIAALALLATGGRGADAQPSGRPVQRGAEPDAANLLRAERNRTDAIMRRDVKSLRYLLGANYYQVENNGRVRSKADFLQALDRGEFALLGFRVEESEIEVFGDFAIVRGLQVIERGTSAPARRYKSRYVRIWQRVGTQWVNTIDQSTEVKGVSRP
jgi:hypothetical protein